MIFIFVFVVQFVHLQCGYDDIDSKHFNRNIALAYDSMKIKIDSKGWNNDIENDSKMRRKSFSFLRGASLHIYVFILLFVGAVVRDIQFCIATYLYSIASGLFFLICCADKVSSYLFSLIFIDALEKWNGKTQEKPKKSFLVWSNVSTDEKQLYWRDVTAIYIIFFSILCTMSIYFELFFLALSRFLSVFIFIVAILSFLCSVFIHIIITIKVCVTSIQSHLKHFVFPFRSAHFERFIISFWRPWKRQQLTNLSAQKYMRSGEKSKWESYIQNCWWLRLSSSAILLFDERQSQASKIHHQWMRNEWDRIYFDHFFPMENDFIEMVIHDGWQ